MPFKKIKNTLALSVALAASSAGHAQTAPLPLDALTGLLGSIPGLSALPLDSLGGGGLPGLDGLPDGGLPGLDSLGGAPGLDALSPLFDALAGLGGGGAPSLPGLDALPIPGMDGGSGGAPGLDALAPLFDALAGLGGGGAPSIPGLDALPIPGMDGGSGGIPPQFQGFVDYLSPAKIESIVVALQDFGTAIAADPQSLAGFQDTLGPDLVFTLIPVVGVMADDPASVPAYFTEGGTLLNPQITLLPPIPFITAELAM